MKGGLMAASADECVEAEKAGKARARVHEEPCGSEKDLNRCIIEGAGNNVSASIVSSYSTPLALHLGASSSEIGILSAVQSLAGMLSQFPGARLTRSMTRKRLWFIGTMLSRAMLIPMILIGLFTGWLAIWLFIVFLGLFTFFSTMRTPAWSSMVGDMVPMERRGRYFGRRNMIVGLAGIVATLLAGWMVSAYGFPIIFTLALAVSLFSVVFFMKIREPTFRPQIDYHYRFSFNLRDFLYTIKTNRNFAIFTVYITCVNFAVNIASPFIAVYMLKDLQMSYEWFALLVTIGALVQILSFRYWGGVIDKHGNRKVLVVGGVMMCFVPFGYMLSTDVYSMIIVKVFEGFAWGAFDLVIFNYLLAVSPAERRPEYVANHSIMAGLGTVLGSLFGAYLVTVFQTNHMFFYYGLEAVFLVSFLLRLSTTVFIPKIADIDNKETERMPVRYVFWETVAVGPAKGFEHRITQAFQYPYGVRVKSVLGLNNNRKIKITRSREPARSGSVPARTEKKEVHDMGLIPKLGKRDEKEEDEYMEVGEENEPSYHKKTVRVVFHSLETFSDTEKVSKTIKEGNIVFISLRKIKEKNLAELKQSTTKLNKVCIDAGSRIAMLEEDWLIVTPKGAEIV